MFERLKKVFVASKSDAGDAATADDAGIRMGGNPAAFLTPAWMAKGFALKGTIGDRPWKMECIRPSRDYIRGEELRARGEPKLNEDVSVLIMNRALKEALEKRAYQAYTDTLQTTARPRKHARRNALAGNVPRSGLGEPSQAFLAALRRRWPIIALQH